MRALAFLFCASLGVLIIFSPVLSEFLTVCPPSEWKRRLADDVPLKDLPLKTVKTILHELAEICGDDLLNQLDKIPNKQSSHVYSIVSRLLDKSGSKSALATPLEPAPPTAATIPSSAAPTSATAVAAPAEPVDLRKALSEIISRIGSKEETKQGLRDLYHLKKSRPEAAAEIDNYLSNTSAFFQGYISRGLATVESELEDEATPVNPELRAAVFNSPTRNPSQPSASAGDPQEYKQKLDRLRQMYSQKVENPADLPVLPDELLKGRDTPSSDDGFVVCLALFRLLLF